MKKREPKPMKPVKAWAYIHIESGKVDAIAKIGCSKEYAEAYRLNYERIARVEIREVLHGKQ